MTTLLVILWVVLLAALVWLFAVKVQRTSRSRFELNRLGEEAVLRRERLLGVIFALRRFGILLLFGLCSIAAYVLFGMWSVIVIVLTMGVALFLARVRAVSRYAQKIYDKHENVILDFCDRNSWLGVFMLPLDQVPRDHRLESIEHLLHLVDGASFVADEQKHIIQHGIKWHETTVGEIMVGREKILSVKHSELLGPLVLDGLHKSGHSQFPVIKRSIDTIVGILDITDSLEVSPLKASKKAADSMSSIVVRVAASDTLPQALELLQKSKQHMLIVVGSEGETVGLLTIADITGSLLGKTGVE